MLGSSLQVRFRLGRSASVRARCGRDRGCRIFLVRRFRAASRFLRIHRLIVRSVMLIFLGRCHKNSLFIGVYFLSQRRQVPADQTDQDVDNVNHKNADTDYPDDIGKRRHAWNLGDQPKDQPEHDRHNYQL